MGILKNYSMHHWASTLLQPFADKDAPFLRRLSFGIRRFPELATILTMNKHNLLTKGMLLVLQGYRYASFDGDSSGLQLASKRIIGVLHNNDIFPIGEDGAPHFNKVRFDALLGNPDYQSACNLLIYSVFGEIAMPSLYFKGIEKNIFPAALTGELTLDIMGFIKDLFLPLVLFQARFGKVMPEMGTYVYENFLRYVVRMWFLTAFTERGERDGNQEMLVVSLKSCENLNPAEVKVTRYEVLFSRGLATAIDGFLNILRPRESMASHQIMNNSRDAMINMDGSYPNSFFNDIRGIHDILEVNKINKTLRSAKPDADELDSVEKNLGAMRVRQLTGFNRDKDIKIENLSLENKKLRKLLTQKRGGLLSWMNKKK